MSVQQDWEDKRNKRKGNLQKLYNYTMGIIWMSTGLFFLFNKKMGIDWMKSDPVIDTVFGTVGIAYGLFRLYRGYYVSKTYK